MTHPETQADRSPELSSTHPAEGKWSGPVLIDTHTHLYDCYDRVAYFDATLANFRKAGRQLGLACDPGSELPACLLLAEPGNLKMFRTVLEQGELDGGRWRFVPCGDGISMIAQLEGRDALIFIQGRQIRTQERLEVLSLCCDAEIPNDIPTVEALQLAIDHDALPVLPIGAGKWLGSRGRFVEELMTGELGKRFYLGDNAGRWRAVPTPRQFTQAKKRGMWVLPGSGTLAYRSQATRVGRYGILLDMQLDRDRPAASIKQRVRAGGEQPVIFGRPDSLMNFLKLQPKMQIHNFLRGPDWYGIHRPE